MNKAHSAINWENYPSDETPVNESNLNKMDAAIGTIDDRVITLDTTKATKTEVATLVADVTFEESTGIITVTRKNGSVFTIDTKMEKIAVNFDYNPTTQQIILTLIDGTKQYIDLSALITQYEFLDTDTVAFIIGTDGKVSAIVKEGSIEEKHLEPNYLAKIKVEVSKAQASQQAAETSEKNAKESENAAKASETAAATSETNAKSSETAAATSETAAKTSEGNAKKSETAAATSETNAKTSEEAAAESENNARDFEQSCRLRAEEAENSATTAGMYKDDAEVYSTKAQSYAVGGTGSREGEDSDNAKYYYEQVKDVSEGIKGGLQPRGTVAFADLPQLSDCVIGWMFNIYDEFTTTDDFKEGAGNVIPAGSNIYKTSDEKWDVLAGTPVTGIKGANEKSYRRGNVNLTAEDVGAVATGGDTEKNTVSFEEYTTLENIKTGETHKTLFGKIAKAISTLISHVKLEAITNVENTHPLGHVRVYDEKEEVTGTNQCDVPSLNLFQNEINSLNSSLGKYQKQEGVYEVHLKSGAAVQVSIHFNKQYRDTPICSLTPKQFGFEMSIYDVEYNASGIVFTIKNDYSDELTFSVIWQAFGKIL